MVTKGKYIDIDHTAADGIHQTMLVCNSAAPQSMLLSFEWLWFTFTCERMFKNVSKQRRNTLHYPSIVGLLPILQILVSLGKKDYFHKSSNLTIRPFPFFISSCPWRMTSAIAGEDIRYSVSSIVCFLADSFLMALRAFFINPSSSAMMLSSRNNSAFNCNAVIFQFF